MRVDGYSDLTRTGISAPNENVQLGVEKKLLASNPVKGIKKYSEKDTARDRVLSAGEEKKLFAELAPWIRQFVLFLLQYRTRYREALNPAMGQRRPSGIRRRVKVEKTKGKRARLTPTRSLDLLTRLRDIRKAPGGLPRSRACGGGSAERVQTCWH